MQAPSELQLSQLSHMYDAAYARQYYLRTRKLKGRQPGQAVVKATASTNGHDPRTGKTKARIHNEAVARQKKEISGQIKNLEGKLGKLETLIREKLHKEASEDRKSTAKKERAAKDADKPKTAAEKADVARQNQKYRDKNQQKLKNDRKEDSKSSGSSKDTKAKKSGPSVSDLKALATKVRGQIAVAKQKLAAL